MQNAIFRFSDTAESAKDVASRGVESAKETGSKFADKGRGTLNFEIKRL